MDASSHAWAVETFGGAKLGDRRRTARVVRLAASVVARPAGTVPGVLSTSAEREAAFRLLENNAAPAEGISEAVFAATARRCSGDYVVVPVDQSSLTFGDRARKRELGRVGSPNRESRGLQVMTSLALDKTGTTIGVLGQDWWARDTSVPTRSRRARMRATRDLHGDRETGFWVRAIHNACDRLKNGPRPWLQMDRGADAWPVFAEALEAGVLLTVRSRSNRRITLPSGRPAYLRETIAASPIAGTFKLDVPAGFARPAREATIAVRACHITLSVKLRKDKRAALALTAVSATETRRGGDRIEWLLLTTRRVDSYADARRVIDAYAMRWRVEEFHRAWKSGVCNVERSQLRSQAAIKKWATLLAAVAARAVRLTYLARHQPKEPASSEFSSDEIEATFILADKPRPEAVSIGELIALIADRGGFTGKYSGKPPGSIVIARGLVEVEILARAIPRLRKMR